MTHDKSGRTNLPSLHIPPSNRFTSTSLPNERWNNYFGCIGQARQRRTLGLNYRMPADHGAIKANLFAEWRRSLRLAYDLRTARIAPNIKRRMSPGENDHCARTVMRSGRRTHEPWLVCVQPIKRSRDDRPRTRDHPGVCRDPK